MGRGIAFTARGNYRQRACYIENAIGVAIVDKATLLCARVEVTTYSVYYESNNSNPHCSYLMYSALTKRMS